MRAMRFLHGQRRRALRRNLVALVFTLLIGGGAALLQLTESSKVYQGQGLLGPLDALESTAQDLALTARRPESYLQVATSPDQAPVLVDPRELITLVTIDERTLAELGSYNGGYPRALHAQLVDQLLAAPPRVIAFDLGFFEQTPDDPLLAAAFQRAQQVAPPTRIVLGAVGTAPAGQPLEQAVGGDLRFVRGLVPIDSLANNASLGLTNVVPDSRGTVRRIPLLAQTGDTEVPTLGLSVLAAYLRRPQAYDSVTADTLAVAGRRIPIDATRSAAINFFGPPDVTFHSYSFVDVLRGRVDPSAWKNGIVLVGAAGASGLADDYWTPVSTAGRKMAGLEVHANVVATLFSTQFLRTSPPYLQVAPVLGLALITALAAVDLSVIAASILAGLVLAGYSAADVWALYAFGVQLPLATPLLAGGLSFVGSTGYRVGVEQRQARALVRALASVVPPSVAHQIARDPDQVRLGGERRVVSVLFADLRGFTTFSESVEPEIVGRVVTNYLDAMTEVVFQNGGTVDKFVGDQVMALWNAPLDDPEHARHACTAALAMQECLARLSDAWAAEGLPRQSMRIGIHTGPASVGNMGGSRRFAYTAVGDTVNLAARLEPLNNEYGTDNCISQTTLDESGPAIFFLTRFLDLVAVKGKATPVGVYELLGRAEDTELQGRYAAVLEPYTQGVVLYQAREFAAAAERFRSAATDRPSQLYLQRCRELQASPPDATWQPVVVMDHK